MTIRTHEGAREKRRPLNQKQRGDLFEAQSGRCANPDCNRSLLIYGAEDDHAVALVDGGTNDLSNRRLLCTPCHREKSAHEHKQNSKMKRLRYGKARKGPPMPGSKDSKVKKHMDGTTSYR